jgi:hypothetical protein
MLHSSQSNSLFPSQWLNAFQRHLLLQSNIEKKQKKNYFTAGLFAILWQNLRKALLWPLLL